MWPRLLSHPEHSAFALLFCMSMSRLLSECKLQYDWDYDDDATTDKGFRVRDDKGFRIRHGDGVTTEEPDVEVNGVAVERLSPEDTWVLRGRLKGLYAMLKEHPVLMDRRLQVGSTKPQLPRHLSQHDQLKRSFSHMASNPVCPSRTEWLQLRVARDINDTRVEVFQPRDGSNGHQWFYTTTCDNTHAQLTMADCPNCCRGINRHRYHSHCMTKKSFVMALVRKPREEQYDWNWIQVDSSCSCSISPA